MRYHRGKLVKTYRMKEVETGDVFEGDANGCAKFIIKKHPERVRGYYDNVPRQIRKMAEIDKKRMCYGFEVEELNNKRF